MSHRHKTKFNITLNGRKGKFWRAAVQQYSNCEISAGLIIGFEPDNIYLRFDRDGEKPYSIYLRPDEAQAVNHVLSGALWSNNIFALTGTACRTDTHKGND